jgi:protein gp37
MSENSKIEWTNHTFNPWWGCAKVSPGCDHCYAERDSGRFTPGRVLWGVDAERREFGDKHWNEPRRWDKAAAAAGVRARVFCASMADVFDKNAPDGARERLWQLIKATPHLDWLLLTKRIGNAKGMLPADFNAANYPNVWLGISVVNQEEADRDIKKLLLIPARLRWLSMEPLLGPVDLYPSLGPSMVGGVDVPALDWVVLGGESGTHARPMHPAWARAVRDQCAAARVPFLYKQWGEWMPTIHEGDKVLLKFPEGQPTGPKQPEFYEFADGQGMARVGKRVAGRLLDDVQHDGYPVVQGGAV